MCKRHRASVTNLQLVRLLLPWHRSPSYNNYSLTDGKQTDGAGSTSADQCNLENLAPRGTATQSSNYTDLAHTHSCRSKKPFGHHLPPWLPIHWEDLVWLRTSLFRCNMGWRARESDWWWPDPILSRDPVCSHWLPTPPLVAGGPRKGI